MGGWGEFVSEIGWNLGLLISLTFVYGCFRRKFSHFPNTTKSIVEGMLFGVAAIVSMHTPVNVTEGVIFDGRNFIVMLASAYTGPIAGIVAGVMTGAYRIHLGGIGAFAGMGAILSSLAIGVLFYQKSGVVAERVKVRHLLGMAIPMTIINLLWVFALPSTVNPLEILTRIAGAVSILNIGGTVFFGLLLSQEHRRQYLVRELRKSQERFRDFAETSSDWLWETDAGGRIIWESSRSGVVNGGLDASDVEGKTREEIAGEMMSDDDWICYREALAIHTDFSDFEYRYYGRDGTIQYALIDGKALFDEAGVYIGHRGAASDITERKQAQDALRESEERLNQSARLARVGYMVWDVAEERCVTCSDIYAEIHGVSVDEFVERASSIDGSVNLAHPDDRERIRAIKKTVHEGTSQEIKYSLLNPDGQVRFVHSIMRPVFDERGRVIQEHEVLQDISHITETEEYLHKALLDAERANQAKTEFLATMSHEFRTPLNAILGFSEMIRAQYFGPLGSDSYRDYANDIHQSGEHMLALINDILDISAIEAGKRHMTKETVDVAGILYDSAKSFDHRAMSKNIELVIEAPEDLPSLYADRRSIAQIVLNLLSNAVKFTPKGGTVMASAKAEGDSVVVNVNDTGIGVPPEKLETITEPFAQSHTDPHLSQEGTGLGLSIVKVLAEANDGTLDIQSDVGKGTRITVTFPSQRSKMN